MTSAATNGDDGDDICGLHYDNAILDNDNVDDKK